ncbi:MAG: DUF4241 domain-containing protein, partial [Peptococcaceae bacterium]|nr:DUF4241 domain-containing protein [Peptococcaceae bacterium]
MMKQPSAEWLKLWAEKRSLLTCAVDLNAYFTLAEMAGKKLDRLAIGKVSFPTGRVIVRDPFVYLSPECEPYFLPVPPGEYETELAVIVADDEDEARYAALRVKIFAAEAVRYEEALTGAEDLANLKEDEYFGFNVGAGLVCICDT